MLYRSRFAVLLTSLFVTACAAPQTAYIEGTDTEIAAERQKQKILVLQTDMTYEKRLQNVAYPIRLRNNAICKEDVGPVYGFSTWTIDSVGDGYKSAAKKQYHLTQRPTIRLVVAGSAADKAHIKQGDEILSVNNTMIETGMTGEKQILDIITSHPNTKSMPMTVQRGAKAYKTTLYPVTACNYGVVYEADETVINAYADGDAIHIGKPIMRLASNDTDLALVVAHEFAHNAAGHIDAQRQNAMGAGIVGILLETAIVAAGGYADGSITNNMMQMGAQAHSVGFEQEADYVGMYMMARAGYSTDHVADFWRVMATEADPDSITVRSTHPSAPERFVAIEKTHAEIIAKKRSKQALLPNIRTTDTAKKQTENDTPAYN